MKSYVSVVLYALLFWKWIESSIFRIVPHMWSYRTTAMYASNSRSHPKKTSLCEAVAAQSCRSARSRAYMTPHGIDDGQSDETGRAGDAASMPMRRPRSLLRPVHRIEAGNPSVRLATPIYAWFRRRPPHTPHPLLSAYRFDGELTKIWEEWSLRDTSTAAGRDKDGAPDRRWPRRPSTRRRRK